MVTRPDDAEEEVIEEEVEAEVVEETPAPTPVADNSAYDAFWKNPDDGEGASSRVLMVYTIVGLNEKALRVGPLTVVAPTEKIAFELLADRVSSPMIQSIGEYIAD